MLKTIKIFIFALIMFVFCNGANASYYGPTWDKGDINVYINSDNAAMTSLMKSAFTKWQNAANQKFKFIYLDEDKDADIKVSFPDEVDGSDGEIGSYNTTIQGGRIVKAEISIISNKDKKYSDLLIYKNMLHEVGHILGLPDSNRNLGIMHSPVNEKQELITNDIVKLYRFNSWSTMNQNIIIKK